MTPNLSGRIQTRWFLLLIVGVPWTVLVMAFGALGPLAYFDLLVAGLRVLALVGVLGTGWELAYHALMQVRWEKDWPALFGFWTIVNEGALLSLVTWLLGWPLGSVGWVHFVTTWVLMWCWANAGPMRVLAPRWRYRGGRLL